MFDAARPWWRFTVTRAPDGAACGSQICDKHRDATLRGDDPWWEGHIPPLHWNCNCRIAALGGRLHPTDRALLALMPSATGGFGTGTIPFGAADEAVALDVDLAANRLGIDSDMLGRPPADGGTGRGYHPGLSGPGFNVPGAYIEIGPDVTRPWPTPWPEWDTASNTNRIEATLAHEFVELNSTQPAPIDRHREALREAQKNPNVSAGALKILRTQHLHTP